MDIKITREQVREAYRKNPDEARILRDLFPAAFQPIPVVIGNGGYFYDSQNANAVILTANCGANTIMLHRSYEYEIKEGKNAAGAEQLQLIVTRKEEDI